MTPQPAVRAGIYCRISDDRSGEGLGVSRQQRECIALAATLGWMIADTYIDNDLSAYSGKRRPEYERLLGDVARGRVTGLVVWHPDRLNRSPLELERLIAVLDRSQVSVQSVTAGFLDLGTASGRAVARTLGAWARFESEHRGERVRAKMMESALAGAATGGANRPFGYASDKLTIEPSEARVIREMVRRVLNGERLVALCEELTRRGVVTSGGRAWSPHHLGSLLMSARIAGWRGEPRSHTRYGSRFLVRAQWSSIVPRADVERVRALLADDTVGAGRNRWLLAGILRCGRCGYPMKARSRHPGWNQQAQDYSCSQVAGEGCGCRSIVLARTDAYVTCRIFDAIGGGLIGRILRTTDALYAAERDVIASHEQGERQLAREYDDGAIGRSEWTRRQGRLDKHKRDRTLDLAEMPNRKVLAALPVEQDSASSAWAAMSLRDQRALVRALAVRITVSAGRRGAPQPVGPRLSIAWRV